MTGWQLGGLGDIDYGAQQNNPVWKQMVSEPAKWSLILPGQHRPPVSTPPKVNMLKLISLFAYAFSLLRISNFHLTILN